MADQGGLQLLPETRRRVEIKREGARGPIVLGIVLIVIVLIVFFVADSYLASLTDELADLDQQVLDIERRRDKEAEEQVGALNKQLLLISGLLDNHVFWSEGFDRFERLTLPALKFVTLTSDISREQVDVRINTVSFTNLAKQISAYLSDSAIVDVNVGNTTTLPNGLLDANLSIKFDSSKFLKK